jgi:hypothetical protein
MTHGARDRSLDVARGRPLDVARDRGRLWPSAALLCACAALACGRSAGVAKLELPDALAPDTLTLAGEFNIPPLGRFPSTVGLPFGGISGLAPLGNTEWLAICDEREGSRMYRLQITGSGPGLRVTPVDVIGLEVGGNAPAAIDPEGIALTPDGTVIIASEGANRDQGRVPPAIVEYDTDGRFIRQIPLRDRVMPNPSGPLTRGARGNAALESLTMVPGGRRFFTGLETALVQDGQPAAIGRGTISRLLEYVREGDTYVAAREFAYAVEPIDPAPFDAAVTISGLVELLALDGNDLLALERTYLEEKAAGGREPRSLNRIRVFRLSLAAATDIAAIESLAGATFTPVQKTLLLDLSNVKGLSAELATLENFEGLAIGPRLDGNRSLLLVSDDNFHKTQRTSFLLFRIGGGK